MKNILFWFTFHYTFFLKGIINNHHSLQWTVNISQKFSPNNVQYISHSSPVRASYLVSLGHSYLGPISSTTVPSFHNSNTMEISFSSYLHKRSPHNSAYGMTAHYDMAAVLSWHVQKFVAIWWPWMELQQCKSSNKFENPTNLNLQPKLNLCYLPYATLHCRHALVMNSIIQFAHYYNAQWSAL